MRQAILHARMLIRYKMGDPETREQQIHDLMDAIENIPGYLLRHADFWTFDGLDKQKTMMSYLQMYDDKWAKTEHGISLMDCYRDSRGIAGTRND